MSRANTKPYRENRQDRIYVYGNTARKLDVRRELQEPARKPMSHTTRKNRDKAHHMSVGYVAFLLVALCAAGIILINYIQLQAELTNRMESVAGLESDLNNARIKNDEDYSRILSSVDLEEIKRIAIGELGMTYASEGQIVTYTNEGNDYMRQVSGNEQ